MITEQLNELLTETADQYSVEPDRVVGKSRYDDEARQAREEFAKKSYWKGYTPRQIGEVINRKRKTVNKLINS